MSALKLIEAATPEEVATCLAIRRAVFVEEQGVDPAEELDGLDDHCRHFLALIDGDPLGTARLKPTDGALKVQRVAVLAKARGTGLGAQLMRHLMREAAALSAPLVLGAQVSAIGFYEKLGFAIEGEEYMDAGIPHRDMRWTPPAAEHGERA